jgi:hypothetical protein
LEVFQAFWGNSTRQAVGVLPAVVLEVFQAFLGNSTRQAVGVFYGEFHSIKFYPTPSILLTW